MFQVTGNYLSDQQTYISFLPPLLLSLSYYILCLSKDKKASIATVRVLLTILSAKAAIYADL